MHFSVLKVEANDKSFIWREFNIGVCKKRKKNENIGRKKKQIR